MPIGNLTSQILANVYLNEFDRYVRHQLKPLAYLRYGDDFVIVDREFNRVQVLRIAARGFLANFLGLAVNSNNNIVLQSNQGLYFLGHRIYHSGAVVNKKSFNQAMSKLNANNSVSYLGMRFGKSQRLYLEWLLRRP